MPEQISFFAPPKRRVLTFDLETLRSAGEVGGWSNIRHMGMACGVVYDSLDQEFRTYREADVTKLVEDLKRADLIVGFNHIRFDYEVLSGYVSENYNALPNFDILIDVTRLLNHRLKLQSLASATLGEGKSADGMQSLAWVKQGRYDLIVEYCKQDVDVTRRLFEYGVKEGKVRYENRDELVWLPVEWNVDRLIEAARKRRTTLST